MPIIAPLTGNLVLSGQTPKGFFNIAAGPIEIGTSIRSLLSQFPATPRDEALDQTFDCLSLDASGNPIGVIVISTTVLGQLFNVSIVADPFLISLTPLGNLVIGIIRPASPIGIGVSFKEADITVEFPRQNWVRWSNIGALDFTIGKDNVAGERPLDWKGWVYEILKLGNKVVAYGENGVSALTPAGNTYGLEIIYRGGIKSKQAVINTGDAHYFIDQKSQLWKLKDSLERLDYSEYLIGLTNPVMSYDVLNALIYICDGTTGYVFNPRTNSFARGPVNVTGIGSQGGTLYVVSPATIVVPPFQITTDIYDMGTRKGKTIRSVEVGTALARPLQVQIDYRYSKAQDFNSTNWYATDGRGMAFISIYGHEFKFKVKIDTYERFRLDYLKLNGVVHDN